MLRLLLLSCLLWIPRYTEAAPAVLVQDGTAKAAIWHDGTAKDAVEELARYVERISGAKMEIRVCPEAEAAPDPAPAIVVGSLALRLGLPPPPKTLSGDGYRLLRRQDQILLAGEKPDSTYYAACHFLETLGVRWFFDNALGEVVPQTKTLTVDTLDLAEQPSFLSRSIWGPNWHSPTWKRRNRCGGIAFPTGHDWGHVPSDTYFKDHPEYYSLRGGERRAGNWLCTSNPDVRRIFADALVLAVKGKEPPVTLSISPPDGRGFCECDACKALDVPDYREPSSGSTCMSDRYQDFYNFLGEEVAKANPAAILNFYAYSDYSLPPKRVRKAPATLSVWMAPIRFCRLHGMKNPLCESRQRLRQVIEDWQSVVSRIGLREYNYNLAELTVPFSKVSIWKEDIPFLHQRGCLGLNIESLALWHIYGPHTYLIARLAWNANADVDALMDDFYQKFCGRAAPQVKAYWERIDRAYRETDAHAGCFYAIPAVWKPELLQACQQDLDAALAAAEDSLVRSRIEMFRKGLENVRYFLAVRDATNQCDFVKARETFEQWMAHMDQVCASGIHGIAEYKRGYAPRFLSGTIEQGAVRVSGKYRRLATLPDEWEFRYDAAEEGVAQGWPNSSGPAEEWRRVKTFSATLDEQGIPEQLTWLWYRTDVDIPDVPAEDRLFLWLGEIDGGTTEVFVNGEKVGEGRGKRSPVEVEVTGKLRKGRNRVAVRIDHRQISELLLGGLIKPAMVYAGPEPVPAPAKGK